MEEMCGKCDETEIKLGRETVGLRAAKISGTVKLHAAQRVLKMLTSREIELEIINLSFESRDICNVKKLRQYN